MNPLERLAVIDLGSNSFRLVVFMAGDGWWKRTDEIYESVRIGEGLAETGKLQKKPISRALATLDVFAHFVRASDLRSFQANLRLAVLKEQPGYENVRRHVAEAALDV